MLICSFLQLVDAHPNGYWTTRLAVEYREKYKEEPPAGLENVLSEWTDIVVVERWGKGITDSNNRCTIYCCANLLKSLLHNMKVSNKKPPLMQYIVFLKLLLYKLDIANYKYQTKALIFNFWKEKYQSIEDVFFTWYDTEI